MHPLAAWISTSFVGRNLGIAQRSAIHEPLSPYSELAKSGQQVGLARHWGMHPDVFVSGMQKTFAMLASPDLRHVAALSGHLLVWAAVAEDVGS